MSITVNGNTYLASTDGQIYGKYPAGDAPVSAGSAAVMLALGIDVAPTPTGTTYYLDNTHINASDSNDGLTESTPWLTLGKALNTLAAGDMLIGDGTYTEASDLLPANSGTSGNPIIYRAKTPRSFIVDQNDVYDGFRLDANSINYTVFDGLEIKNTYGSDGGGGVFTKDDNISIHVFNCYIHNVDCQTGGNAGGIRFDKQTGGVAYNNIIHTVTVGGVDSNNAASIHGYGHNEAIIAYNKVYNSYHGFDTKNNQTVNGWTVLNNDVAVTSGSAIYINVIGVGQPSVACIGAEIYNNLFRSGNIDLKCFEHNPQSTDFTFRNNVLLTEGLVIYEMEDAKIYDNIFDFAGSGSYVDNAIITERRDLYSLSRVCTLTYCDYNNFTSAPTFTTNRDSHDGGSEVTSMSLATWQAQSAGDGFGTVQYNNPDGNSTTVSPTFDANYIAQNAALSASGRYGNRVGLESVAGPDWSVA